MKKEKLQTWNMGNIALFGALLMSRGITGKTKEELKELMYKALTAEEYKPSRLVKKLLNTPEKQGKRSEWHRYCGSGCPLQSREKKLRMDTK